MESLRDVKRKMQREVENGKATPLTFETVSVDENSFKEITSQEHMKKVLNWLFRLNEYRTGEVTVSNNVYMVMKPMMKQAGFSRTKSVMERMAMHADITRYIRKLTLTYSKDCYMEECICRFSLSMAEKEKCRYKYKNRETFGFLLSNDYILGLYCKCESARAGFAMEYVKKDDSLKQRLLKLQDIKNVLFQCLLLDDVWEQEESICAKLYTIYQIQ